MLNLQFRSALIYNAI